MSGAPLYRDFRTGEELDAQYDTRRWARDPDAAMAFIESESDRARRELDARLDIPYGSTPRERLDLFSAGTGAPVLAFIHGGYWRARSVRDFSCVALGPVAAGVTVALIEYALCPAVRIGEIVSQCRAAIGWLAEHAGEAVHVAGHSAGGHLTAMLMDSDVVRSGCGISGLYDLAPFPHTYLQPDLRLTPQEVDDLSPIRRLPERAGPLLITYGGRESPELRRQSEDFLAAWRAHGLPGERLEQPDADHYTAIDGLRSPDSPLTRALLRQTGRVISLSDRRRRARGCRVRRR